MIGATPTADRFGTPNGAYVFDGRKSAIALGKWFTSKAFTVGMWIKADVQLGGAVLIDNNHAHSWNWVCQSSDPTQNRYAFARAEFTLPTNKWCHLVLWYDGTNVVVMIDGVVVARDKYTFDITSDVDLNLGYWVVDRARYFKGAMDDVVLYDRAIGQDELQGLIDWAWGKSETMAP